MIRWLFPALLFASGAGAGDLCDREIPGLIYAACGGAARAELLLLPEDSGPTPQGALDVTGAYTATDRRGAGLPKPVGLFVRRGEVVSREYVRFDGVLTVTADGRPAIHYRRAVRWAGETYDLERPERRAALIRAVAQAGGGLMQSHLLIIDGRVDTSAVANAPIFRRRMLFQTEAGDIGVHETSPEAMTLDRAARTLATRHAPAMALNLDMGGYNFCRRGPSLCGPLTPEQTGKLSNLLRLR